MDLERIEYLVRVYGAYAVCLGSLFDNTGIPFFFIAGLGVARTLSVAPESMLLAAAIGSTLGDLVFYVVGRYWLTKERLAKTWVGRRLGPLLDASDRAMKRWGVLAVLFGRFIPYAGKAIPLVAGSCRMSWPLAILSAAGGSAMLMGFYYLYADSAYDAIRGQGGLVTFISLAVFTVVVVVLWWTNRRLRSKSAG